MRTSLFVLMCSLVCACATTESTQPRTRERSAGEMSMGYQDAVDLGLNYLANNGYQNPEVQGAEQVRLNIWRVRFGLAPKGSGKIVELYFDGSRRTLIKTAGDDGVVGKLTPPPVP